MISTIALVACLWSVPGADPYTGSVDEALSRFTIPAYNRAELATKILLARPDERFYIGRDAVWSDSRQFNPFILMHFGRDKLCWGVERRTWPADAVQAGNVYCSGGYCVGKPDVCGNITQLFGRQEPVPIAQIVHTAPEPPMWALLLVPLWWTMRRGKQA